MTKSTEESRVITLDEFRRRLVALCLGGVGPGLPRKRRDVQILLKSMALAFSSETVYSEAEVNEVLDAWLERAGPRVEIDRVSLRRHLVDDGYLARDTGGSEYRLAERPADDGFGPGIQTCEPPKIIQEGRTRSDQRRARHTGAS